MQRVAIVILVFLAVVSSCSRTKSDNESDILNVKSYPDSVFHTKKYYGMFNLYTMQGEYECSPEKDSIYIVVEENDTLIRITDHFIKKRYIKKDIRKKGYFKGRIFDQDYDSVITFRLLADGKWHTDYRMEFFRKRNNHEEDYYQISLIRESDILILYSNRESNIGPPIDCYVLTTDSLFMARVGGLSTRFTNPIPDLNKTVVKLLNNTEIDNADTSDREVLWGKSPDSCFMSLTNDSKYYRFINDMIFIPMILSWYPFGEIGKEQPESVRDTTSVSITELEDRT